MYAEFEVVGPAGKCQLLAGNLSHRWSHLQSQPWAAQLPHGVEIASPCCVMEVAYLAGAPLSQLGELANP
jgi:hypothetical protein